MKKLIHAAAAVVLSGLAGCMTVAQQWKCPGRDMPGLGAEARDRRVRQLPAGTVPSMISDS